ncbi:hypothetical protein PoB_005997500 [Plakobranchus ocellatus]|uniref:Uncharacterized protein n=1 Tax=Plakobranchus ocellatus TaxID=259542 RepID=A0AAV4CNP2_9GAST|nr:hypothetical protein PoB_005997500 [Plakobranchus ocellatus]
MFVALTPHRCDSLCQCFVIPEAKPRDLKSAEDYAWEASRGFYSQHVNAAVTERRKINNESEPEQGELPPSDPCPAVSHILLYSVADSRSFLPCQRLGPGE